MTTPKLFVSYSWTTPDHEARVLQLATELVQSGVDVIIDKWHLREGQEADKFMEQMVTDPEIKKVILACDNAYAEKADARKGGVGTEAQIISRKIYEQQSGSETKFVAVVMEHDQNGKAFLPAYYSSRVYIDFTDPARYAEEFDKLLRWIYDKPLHVRPPLGETPTFLSADGAGPALATSVLHRRAMDAVRNNRAHAIPAVGEYFNLFAREMEKLRLDPQADPFDDAVVQSIDAFTPYRNEAAELFITLATYRDTLETRVTLHRFFEQLVPYLYRPPTVSSWKEWDFDNFRFIIHELFLYAMACLIRHQCFDSAAYLMANEYYVPGRSEYGRDTMVPFHMFQRALKSLDYRNQRLKLNRASVPADLLEQRCRGLGIEFRHIMQADFVLYLRDNLHYPNTTWDWWPETLTYTERHGAAFEIFARSRSTKFFNHMKVVLGIERNDELLPFVQKLSENPQLRPRFGFHHLDIIGLLGFNEIATKP